MAKHTGQTSRATCLETRQEVGDPAISFHTVRFVIFFKVNNMGRYRERIDRDTGVGSSPLFPGREQASGQHCPYFLYTIVACRVLKSRETTYFSRAVGTFGYYHQSDIGWNPNVCCYHGLDCNKHCGLPLHSPVLSPASGSFPRWKTQT